MKFVVVVPIGGVGSRRESLLEDEYSKDRLDYKVIRLDKMDQLSELLESTGRLHRVFDEFL